ncbi:MAG: glycosyltransferase family 39 protein [Alphaproteobacteria bacterium]|nr:glycosyltransferase family 39 protein [Alphaproteobacteria bacterium]
MAALSTFRLTLGLVTALTVLRLAALVATGLELHGDEAQYWSWAQDLDFGYFTKPPLIAWVIAATTGVCGDAEACVRASSPLLHAGTALVLYGLGRSMVDGDTGRWVGFWAAALWITLPSVAFSSLLVSTDVPLLACWAVAIASLRRLLDTRGWGWAVATGLAVGVGLLAKYAMAYALIGFAVHLTFTRDDRWIVRDPRGLLVAVLALAVLSPNLAWNAAHDFATVGHLGDNANLNTEKMFRVSKALEFLGQQAGVFGPVPFLILAWRLIAWARGRASAAERFLLAFAVPPLIVVMVQAFLSRANANWAVTAYPTATVLVALWLVSTAPSWVRLWTVGPHLVASLVFALVIALWPGWRIEATERGFGRLEGWRSMAEQLRPVLLTHGEVPILMTDRMTMAALLYYLRDQIGGDKRPVLMWDWNKTPEHHYEMAVPYHRTPSDPVMLITDWRDPRRILVHFEQTEPITTLSVTRFGRTKRLEVWALDGYRGE